MHFLKYTSQPVHKAIERAYEKFPLLLAIAKKTDELMRNKKSILKASTSTQRPGGYGDYNVIEYYEDEKGQTLVHIDDYNKLSINSPITGRSLDFYCSYSSNQQALVTLVDQGALKTSTIKEKFNEGKFEKLLNRYLYGNSKELSELTLDLQG